MGKWLFLNNRILKNSYEVHDWYVYVYLILNFHVQNSHHQSFSGQTAINRIFSLMNSLRVFETTCLAFRMDT